MKKNLLFFLAFFLAAASSFAQNTVVTIGTSVTASNTIGPFVITTATTQGNFSRHIALYPAAEIAATPFSARAITKIAWYKDDTARFIGTGGYLKIYLKHTTATDLGTALAVNWTTEMAGATEVYNVALPSVSSGAGWKEFTLATPFIWDGARNLEVLVDWHGQGPALQAINWRYSAFTGRKSATALNALPTMSASANRPNTQLTFTSFSNDAGITNISSPAATILPNVSVPVQANLFNFGSNGITSATIGWQLNNVAQPDYTWNGSLNAGQGQNVTLANRSFPAGAYTLKVYPKTVNGQPDGLRVNDTTSIQFVACTALSGNYTINKNLPASATNVPSFTAAAQLLNSCGVSGPVTFTVAPGTGPYNEALSLGGITGASATNTVTFQGNGNVLTSDNPAVVLLDRANYVTLNNLVITQTSTATLCYGVQLLGPSDNATISNCTINMPFSSNANVIGILLGTGSNSNTAGNYSSNSLFQNNIINGGYYSIRINGLAVTGSSPIGAVNNRITGNQFRDFYSNGIYMANADGTRIENNVFTRPTATSLSNFSGVYITNGSINTLVNKNRFHNTHGAVASPTSQVTPITIDAAAPIGSENIIKNNLFYNLNNTGNITGISLFGSTTGAHILNNTFSIENPNRPASNTSAIKAINLSGSGANVKYINNIVTINMPGTGGKHAIYLNAAPVPTFQSNNNVLHLAAGQTNAHTGFLTSNRTSLTDWQGANSSAVFDVNSEAFNPAYADLANGNLKPTSPDVNNIGQPLAAVTDDFTGAPRHATTPDPGAYEFDLGTNDAGITAITSPGTPVAPGTAVPVTVTFKNFGTAPLTAATIGWKVNGVAQPDFSWTGTTAPNATSAPVTIGNFTFSAGSYSVCAWTKNPNGGPDANPANDSTCINLNACAPMAGNYTIDKNMAASATNFQSFTEVATRLHTCGVSGRVIISVVAGSGPYNEQVVLQQIPGASATNSIVFRGNSNTLTATPTAQKTAILKLDGAAFVKLQDLTVTMTGTPAAGNPTFSAIQLVNNSNNDTIANVTVNMPHVSFTNGYLVGVLGAADLNTPGNNANHLVFTGNTINGGLYGIKLNGNANSTGAVNNRITGNTFADNLQYGIALENTDNNLVENNEIGRPTHLNPFTYYGIALAGASKNNRISKNHIRNMWGVTTTSFTGASHGIYLTGLGAPAGSENLIVNNLVYDTDAKQNAYGIYNNGSSGHFIYHNTISGTPTNNYYGYYQTATAVANVKFNNNIIAPQTTGPTGVTYAMYLGAAIETNNNAFYFPPNIATAFVGRFGGLDYATLTDWKTAHNNGFDQQSVFGDPMFATVGTAVLVPISVAINNIGKSLPAVTTDLLGNARHATTPDPGTYEFTPVLNDVGVTAILSPGSGCGLSGQEIVTIQIKNFAANTQTSFPVSFQVGSNPPVVETFTGSVAFNTTTTYTFTAKANLSAQGPHTLVASTLLPADGVASNDAKTETIVNSVQASLPVTLDFETAATGITAVRTVTRANSAVAEATGASFGAGSTKGLLMDGVDQASWVLPIGQVSPWANNADNFAAAYLCISTAGIGTADSLVLTFNLKQLFKGSNANTNFRVTVNGTQVGNTYRPPFDPNVTPVAWQKVRVDLGAYKNLPVIQVGLESNVKEAYANGTGTANLIDNISVVHKIVNGTKPELKALELTVYPNPSNGLFNVQLPNGNYTLEVTDLTGKTIYKQTRNSGNAQLDLSGTAKGVYLLKVTSAEGAAIRKLIIE